ncbi:ABC transporter substrate-binding protein [Paenibacillus sp. NEAU-GSW1]|uniref:ABC transporter substrate-binding protein n=1 Tax=Paenibacillus sp. NEAU-GSW1 TaxID=2682486 RepID=UPI0012E1FBF4|nr:extracellular solute-binding protein [Paenibacillus sp. NEAU-GSW1]MUT66155.1 extracellular solute-binding protein [Paenibacillus sp. NEAU-GSW1]
MSNRAGVKKWGFLLMTVMMVVALLSACSGGNSDNEAKTRVLRVGVLYGGADNEPYFRQQYTDMYEMMHKNIKFEIVGAIDYSQQRFETPNPDGTTTQPDPYEKMKEMLTGQNPVDVVVIDYNMLRRMTQDNLLQQLDPLIQQSKFDLADYVPTVIDGIKAAGDNNIYALTPTFSASALYYNKKMFADAGVEPPTDNMTWDDIINLARRVSSGEGEDRKFGLSINRYSGDPFNDAQNYGAALQLKMWDDKGEKMLVNTSDWESVWTTVSNLYKEKLSPSQEDMNKIYEAQQKLADDSGYYSPITGDLFLSGKVAMTIADYGYINEITNTMNNASKIKNFEPFEWDVVTPPTHSSKPNIGGNIFFSQLMGINQKAANAEDAWDFIQFTNSKEWAELKSRSTYELVARKEYLKPKNGASYNIDAFTTLLPVPPATTDSEKLMREKPGIWEAQQPGYELFQQVIKGDKTVKEALQEWETKGNAVLQRINTSPDGKDGGGTIDVKPLDSSAEAEAVPEG